MMFLWQRPLTPACTGHEFGDEGLNLVEGHCFSDGLGLYCRLIVWFTGKSFTATEGQVLCATNSVAMTTE